MIRRPTLEVMADDRVLVRRVRLPDLDAIYRGVRDSLPELAPWSPWAKPDYSRSDAADWLARSWLGWSSGSQLDFVVAHPDDGHLIGIVGLNGIDPEGGRANLGYWIRSDEAGNGYCTAAARLVAHFAFAELELSRLRLFHAVGNEGSRRVAEKVGFVLEGRQRARAALHGHPVDTLLYSLIDPCEIRDD